MLQTNLNCPRVAKRYVVLLSNEKRILALVLVQHDCKPDCLVATSSPPRVISINLTTDFISSFQFRSRDYIEGSRFSFSLCLLRPIVLASFIEVQLSSIFASAIRIRPLTSLAKLSLSYPASFCL